jgi:hypothetical protein
MIDEIFSALISAWRVTFVASVVLAAALSIASVWDSTVYFEALNEALTMDRF